MFQIAYVLLTRENPWARERTLIVESKELFYVMYVEMGGPCRLLKLRQMGTHTKGVLPSLVPWFLRASTRDFRPALAALVGPVQNIFFLTGHYFPSFVPIAQQAGKAAVPRHLSLY